MTASGPAIYVENLRKVYGGKVAVESLSLQVENGEVFGFLGPNGAGKTTAMAMILGLVAPHAGSIEILGHDALANREAALRRVGAIVETPTYYPYLSGHDNLRATQQRGNCIFRRNLARFIEDHDVEIALASVQQLADRQRTRHPAWAERRQDVRRLG